MKRLSCLLALPAATSYAATIRVPAKQPTIQAAINVAHNGDTVVVAPGTYFEINFMGKAITVRDTRRRLHGGAIQSAIDIRNLSISYNGGTSSLPDWRPHDFPAAVVAGWRRSRWSVDCAPFVGAEGRG